MTGAFKKHRAPHLVCCRDKVRYTMPPSHQEMGVWKARFSLHPFKKEAVTSEYTLNSPEMIKWSSTCKFVSVSPGAHEWFEEKRTDIHEKRVRYLEKWNTKTDEDKKLLTFLAEDGMENPLWQTPLGRP